MSCVQRVILTDNLGFFCQHVEWEKKRDKSRRRCRDSKTERQTQVPVGRGTWLWFWHTAHTATKEVQHRHENPGRHKAPKVPIRLLDGGRTCLEQMFYWDTWMLQTTFYCPFYINELGRQQEKFNMSQCVCVCSCNSIFVGTSMSFSLWEWEHFWKVKHLATLHFFKSVVCYSIPFHFLSNSVNISSPSASCPFCVCTEKKSGVHTQPWLCKWETNRVARTEPHNSCSCTGQQFGQQRVNKYSPYLASHTSAELIWLPTEVWSQNKQIFLWFNGNKQIKRMLK